MRTIAPALTALVLLLAPGAAHAATPSPEEVAAACSSTPPGGAYAPNEVADLRAFALCAVRELRGRRTSQDARLAPAARAGLGLAVRLPEASAASRRRVRATVLRSYDRRCAGRAAVRVVTADSSPGGDARSPLAIARFLAEVAGTRGAAPLLGRSTRIAVVARPGRVFAGTSGGAIALLVAGGTCTPRS